MDVDLFGTAVPKIAVQSRYRYILRRSWYGSPLQCTWIMLNPSTADDVMDDPTIRRCMAFSKSWGYGNMLVVNLFALRATDPKALREDSDPVGSENDAAIAEAVLGSAAVICAWGSHAYAARRANAVLEVLRHTKGSAAARPLCLGTTKDGSPRHPLYVKAGTPLVSYIGANS